MKRHLTRHLLQAALLACSCGIQPPASGQASSCELEISTSESYIDGRVNAAGIRPGDTICLLPGTRSFLWIRYLHGTAEAPIVIRNSIGGVNITNFYYGLKIDSCSHVKLSGKGVPYIDYGIKIHDINGGGMSIEGLSTDVEVEGIEITGTVFVGIFAKTDPDCDFLSTRDKYVMRNISIHDNYMHQTGMEGMYIGSSFYTGYIINCDGHDTLVYPHVIRGVQVYRNRVEYAGWDGIQVASSDSGCAVYDNYVAYDSDSAVYNQMSGILIGGGSGCDCYNNTVTDGKGVGINVFGLGNEKIYNNLIIRAGMTFPDPYPLISGIYFGDVVTLPGASFLVANNTIISPKVFGIHFKNTESSGNLAVNNLIMGPGDGFFDGTNLVVQENCTFQSLDFNQFVDPPHGNYDLKASSQCVNNASPMIYFNLGFDIKSRSRPFAWVNDMGAYECHDSSLLSAEARYREDDIGLQVTQLGRTGTVRISFVLPDESFVSINVFGITGKAITNPVGETMLPGKHILDRTLSDLNSGIYLCTVITGSIIYSKKFHLIR
jgi:hypothetical protein